MAKKKSGKTRKNLLTHYSYTALREYKGVSFDLRSLQEHGAHAIGIGRKRTEGEVTDKLCLRYYVARKRPLDQLSSAEQVPKRFKFFSRRRQGNVIITTDVIEAPVAQFEEVDPERRQRPVPGGVSGGTPGDNGTLGGWVWDKTDDSVVMLSNRHVFDADPGTEILQQSISDGGALPADRIGRIKRGVPRSDTEPNVVDCAIGDPDSADLVDATVLEIGPAVFEVGLPLLDLEVEKYGQSSRHTFGRITDADWSGLVSGRPFEQCLRIEPQGPSTDWSQGGDSGSLIFDRRTIAEDSDIKPVVALHFAGMGTHGVGCKIQNVFAALDLTTLSAGALEAFLDGLFEVETAGEVSEETEGRLRGVAAAAAAGVGGFAPRPFVRAEQEHRRAAHFCNGIAHDLRQRLAAAKRGREVGRFVERHQAELLGLVMHHGDVRRSIVAALRPLVAGTVTTTEVLERVLTAEDLTALGRAAREMERLGSDRLRKSLAILRSLAGKAEGRSLADILDIEL